MRDAYDGLTATGAITSLKRDIVLEASDDLYYIVHIRNWFTHTAGAAAANAAASCTARIVDELLATKLCFLATWSSEGYGGKEHIQVQKTAGELLAAIDAIDASPFELFLIATDRGCEWASRYKVLVSEL